jgi:glucokinase
MPGTARRQTILAADIGGTHCRFAVFRLDAAAKTPAEGLRLVRQVRFDTAGSDGSAGLMRRLAGMPGSDGGYFLPSSPEPLRIDAAVFGIPGATAVADPSLPPLADEVCVCPNISWPLEAAPVSAALGGVPVRFINDFVANGFACALVPEIADARIVIPGSARPQFPRAVVGAGTGLGHCLILPGERPIVAGAEAGHALFAFTEEEAPLARRIGERAGRARIINETVVSGSGLALLYACRTGKAILAQEAPALAAADPEVLALAARFYGRAVCHYALATLPLGGIFITGGLAAHLPQVLEHPEFAAELRERNAMDHVLRDVPVMHARNHDLGLWGAAACASLRWRG